jgi:glycosyltransferase involved in cell wall biosynthesis
MTSTRVPVLPALSRFSGEVSEGAAAAPADCWSGRNALRILQLYPKSDYFTGAGIQLRELARGLHGRGHHVVVATRPSGLWAEQCAAAGIAYAPLPMRHALDLGSVWKLARVLRAHRIEVVHCQKGRARTLALLAGLLVKIPVLVLNRGVSFPLDRWNRLGYTLWRVTAIVAVCESIKRGLVDAGVPDRKIEVIYSGTDLARFHPQVDGSAIRRELRLGPEQTLITQVGIRSWRGNDDVLEAMTRVHRAAPLCRLLFVGAPPPRISSMMDTARRRGLGDVVAVLGHRHDIPEILAASDLVVDASYAGVGLTGSLREALAEETPVIGTSLEGIPELITDGETGLLVPPRNPDALAQAILRVIENPTRAKAMARAGRKRVEAQFSMAVKLQRTEALYRRLLDERGIS